jgi:ABC-type multidrug transport system fused ATPase/permease subunit
MIETGASHQDAAPTERWRWRRAPVVVLSRAVVRENPRAAAVLAILVVLTAAAPAGLAVSTGVLVGRLAAHTGDGGRVVSAAAPAGIAIAVLFLLQQILPPVASAIGEDLGRRTNRGVTDRVLAALLRPAGMDHLEDPRTTRAVSDVSAGLAGGGTRDAVVGLANMTIVRGGALGGGLIVALYHWWVVVLLFAAYAYAVAAMSRSYQRMLHSSEGGTDRIRRALYLRDLVCGTSTSREVRVFGLFDWLLTGYLREWRRAVGGLRHERRGAWRVSLSGGTVVLAAQMLTFVMLVVDLSHGDLSVGRFTMYTSGAIALLGFNSMSPDLVAIALAGAMLIRVDELERWTAGFPDRDGGAPARLSGKITFADVGFRYPGSDVWVLRHLDLTIAAGTSTAIVGINGAGKTTLVKLLCGLYQPTEGRITVDGVDLADLDAAGWQRRCAALFQDWIKWGLSARENVLLGAPEHSAPPEALDATARACGLDGVIDRLPDGWSTVLSREFGGVDLSGGQWQRVGLARALWALRAEADILVLDEPTAALDVRGETEMFDLLLNATGGKTIVLVSHRFSTVRRADQILVLENGSVLESGDHQTLLADDTRYARMFRVQADRFVEEETTR